MGIELTQSPDTFGDGAARIAQAPYLAVCLSGTTQGGLCGMRVKAYREDAMRDAMFNDDKRPLIQILFLLGEIACRKWEFRAAIGSAWLLTGTMCTTFAEPLGGNNLFGWVSGT